MDPSLRWDDEGEAGQPSVWLAKMAVLIRGQDVGADGLFQDVGAEIGVGGGSGEGCRDGCAVLVDDRLAGGVGGEDAG